MHVRESNVEGDPRVLLVDSGRGWRGGQRQVLLLLRGLKEKGLHAALAAPETGELFKRASCVVDDLFPVRIAGGADASAAIAIRYIVREHRFNIVHAHDSHAHSVTAVATLGMRGHVRVVVSRRIDTAVARNWPSALKYHRGADMYLAISNAVRDALIDGGVDAERIRLVPSGIDLDRCVPTRPRSETRETLGIGDSAFVIGIVAALTPEKGHALLMRVARVVCDAHPHACFVVAGDGPLRSDLEALTAKLGLGDNVFFVGHREDVSDVIAALDTFVLPSTIEGLGSSIMDAHVLGVPVVASNVGGIPDLVRNNETGILVDPDDAGALVAALGRLIKGEDLRERFVDAGKRQSVGYDFRQMVYKTIEAYRGPHVGRKR